VHLQNDGLRINNFILSDLVQTPVQPVNRTIFAPCDLFKALNTDEDIFEEKPFNLQTLKGICNEEQLEAVQCALENKIGLIQGSVCSLNNNI
jgi:hypothetical protein